MNDNYINYSSALYSLAEDMELTDKVLEQLSKINTILSENSDFAELLDSHAVKCAERLSAAEDVFGGCEEIVLNFIKILTEKHLVHILGRCASAYRRVYNKKHNISYVTAETVLPLGEELKSALLEKLEKVTGKTIVLENRVNPEILGGVVLKAEDSEIDASLLGQLQDMAKSLSGRY